MTSHKCSENHVKNVSILQFHLVSALIKEPINEPKLKHSMQQTIIPMYSAVWAVSGNGSSFFCLHGFSRFDGMHFLSGSSPKWSCSLLSSKLFNGIVLNWLVKWTVIRCFKDVELRKKYWLGIYRVFLFKVCYGFVKDLSTQFVLC